MLSLRRKRFLILLVVSSFLLRFGAVVALRDVNQIHDRRTSPDAHAYNAIALSVASGEAYAEASGVPTRYWAPAFPLLLAAIYRLAGERYALVYTILCLLGTLTCVLTYLIGRSLAGEKFGIVASLLGAVYVPHIYFSTVLLSENLFTVFVAGGSLLLIRYFRNHQVRDLVFSALVIGCGVLTRPFLLLGAVFLAVILLFQPGQGRLARLGMATTYLFLVLVVLSPWAVRNYRLDGRLVLLTTSGGTTFRGGNNDQVLHDPLRWGTWVAPSQLPDFNVVKNVKDEAERDRLYWELGLRWAREHAGWLPFLAAARFVRFWLPDLESANRWYLAIQVAGYMPFLLLFLSALPALRPQDEAARPEWRPVHTLILACMLTAMVFWGSPRFRDGTTPLLMLYAALGVERKLKGWRVWEKLWSNA